MSGSRAVTYSATMPSVTETMTISSPAEQVWPLLRDPALVASCIPGATLSPDQGDGVWRGSVRVKFGPTVAVFRGEATLAFDDTARTCTIEGRGIDGRGASRALASGVVKVSGGDTTEIAVDGSFSVSGPLETFANAGGIHVARALLAEFSANMAKKIGELSPSVQQEAPADAIRPASIPPDGVDPLAAPPPVAPPSPPTRSTPTPAPTPAAEISGFRILWQAFLSWLRGKK
ncbi:SRPBCC family protein [Reyranella sp.]|uniref:SRPBCC family protein n=1 Tax=Reyranella sp. TaxID=1929291 RepID=UPI003D0E8F8C